MRLKEYSKEGKDNQQVFSEKGNNFYNWIFEEIKPYLRGNILETGPEIGNFFKVLLKNFPDNQLILSDFDKYFLKILSKNYSKNDKIIIEYLDLNNRILLQKKVDSVRVICINYLT